MTREKWLTVVGGLLLLIGLITALASERYQNRVMGDAALGVGVWSPEKSSPEYREKARLRACADYFFWIGLAATGCGIALQTIGAVIPLKGESRC
jgi:hypothetical protein